ncbi:hypothetical protein COCOBI_08-0400 [Coccomyxa sp. Obi]|nr:hypothetical protein COCOBI_08-0400 [Coccomyxa sp. Obi]
MAGNPQKHIVVRLAGSSRQLAVFEKDRSAAAVLKTVITKAGQQGTLTGEDGVDVAGDEPELAAGLYFFTPGVMAAASRAMKIQGLAAKAFREQGSRWEEADRLLYATFHTSVELQLQRSRAQAAPSSFPFLQREREVRAFVDDLRKLHMYHCTENTGADIESLPHPDNFSAVYCRAPHLQLFLGPPGVGKTTLLCKLGQCIVQQLKADPNWLKNSPGFRQSLESSMGAPIPFVFKLDLYDDVANEFQCNELMQSVGGRPGTLLALLMLMCVARAINHPDVSGLASLVHLLPDELLAIVQPEHVARFVHKHLPRTNNIGSTQIYAFDEASSLRGRAWRFVQNALRNVVVSKQQLPTPIFFTIVLLSNRWGRMPGGLHHTPATPEAPGTGGTDKSDAASARPLQGGSPAVAQDTQAAAPLQDIEEESDLWHWWPVPHGATVAKAVYLQSLTDVPVPTGTKAKAAKNAQRRQHKEARVANEAQANQAAQLQTMTKKSGNKRGKKRARGEAAPSECGDAAKPAKAKSKRPKCVQI